MTGELSPSRSSFCFFFLYLHIKQFLFGYVFFLILSQGNNDSGFFFFQDLTLVPELGYFWSLKISLFQCNVARAFSRVCSLDLVFDNI